MIFEVLQLERRTGVGHSDGQGQLKLSPRLQAAEDDVNASGGETEEGTCSLHVLFALTYVFGSPSL